MLEQIEIPRALPSGAAPHLDQHDVVAAADAGIAPDLPQVEIGDAVAVQEAPRPMFAKRSRELMLVARQAREDKRKSQRIDELTAEKRLLMRKSTWQLPLCRVQVGRSATQAPHKSAETRRPNLLASVPSSMQHSCLCVLRCLLVWPGSGYWRVHQIAFSIARSRACPLR